MPCPFCGAVDTHYPRRKRRQWRCKHCDTVFSVTTQTPFANRKLPFKKLLLLIFEYASAPSGCAANRLCSRLHTTLRTAYHNLSKLREVLWEQRDKTPLTGLVHADGGYFCGKPRRARKRVGITSAIVNNKLRNRKAGLIPNRDKTTMEPWNLEKLQKRRVVFVLREIHPDTNVGASRTIIAIVRDESSRSVLPTIKKYVDPASEIWTDEGRGYSHLSAWYNHRTVNHSKEYMTDDGVNNNQAESFFARMRRGEYGVYHGMRPQYLAFYANEYAWREDMRRESLRAKFHDLTQKIFRCGHSVAWRRYAQGHRLGIEYMG